MTACRPASGNSATVSLGRVRSAVLVRSHAAIHCTASASETLQPPRNARSAGLLALPVLSMSLTVLFGSAGARAGSRGRRATTRLSSAQDSPLRLSRALRPIARPPGVLTPAGCGKAASSNALSLPRHDASTRRGRPSPARSRTRPSRQAAKNSAALTRPRHVQQPDDYASRRSAPTSSHFAGNASRFKCAQLAHLYVIGIPEPGNHLGPSTRATAKAANHSERSFCAPAPANTYQPNRHPYSALCAHIDISDPAAPTSCSRKDRPVLTISSGRHAACQTRPARGPRLSRIPDQAMPRPVTTLSDRGSGILCIQCRRPSPRPGP
jgi:hypothetical protein